jgi:hypothetical protein
MSLNDVLNFVVYDNPVSKFAGKLWQEVSTLESTQRLTYSTTCTYLQVNFAPTANNFTAEKGYGSIRQESPEHQAAFTGYPLTAPWLIGKLDSFGRIIRRFGSNSGSVWRPL